MLRERYEMVDMNITRSNVAEDLSEIEAADSTT
jgi:hypothetical protein